jgi:hypothetical protein
MLCCHQSIHYGSPTHCSCASSKPMLPFHSDCRQSQGKVLESFAKASSRCTVHDHKKKVSSYALTKAHTKRVGIAWHGMLGPSCLWKLQQSRAARPTKVPQTGHLPWRAGNRTSVMTCCCETLSISWLLKNCHRLNHTRRDARHSRTHPGLLMQTRTDTRCLYSVTPDPPKCRSHGKLCAASRISAAPTPVHGTSDPVCCTISPEMPEQQHEAPYTPSAAPDPLCPAGAGNLYPACFSS